MAFTLPEFAPVLTGVPTGVKGCATTPYYIAWTDAKTAAATAPTDPFNMGTDSVGAVQTQVFIIEGSGFDIAALRLLYTGSTPTATIVKAYGFIPHRPTDRKKTSNENGVRTAVVEDNDGDWTLLYTQGTSPTAAATITLSVTAGFIKAAGNLYTPDVYVDLTGVSKVMFVVSTATGTATTAQVQARFFTNAGNR